MQFPPAPFKQILPSDDCCPLDAVIACCVRDKILMSPNQNVMSPTNDESRTCLDELQVSLCSINFIVLKSRAVI